MFVEEVSIVGPLTETKDLLIALENHWDNLNKFEIVVELASKDVLSVANKN